MERNYVLLIVQVVLICTALYLQLIKEIVFSAFLFWTIYICIVVITFILMMQKKNDSKLLALIALEIFIHSLFAFNYPLFYQIDRDTGFETQVANIMIREKMWNPTLGSGYAENYYGYNPVIHILMSFLSIISGVNPEFLAKYVILILMKILILATVYLVMSKLLSKKYQHLSYLALYIYLITPRLRVLTVSRRIMAVFFLLICFITLISEMQSKKKGVLFIIFSFSLVMSDHSISQLFLVFLIFGSFYFAFTKSYLKNFFISSTIIYSCFIIIWEVIFATRLFRSNLNYVKNILSLLSRLFTPDSTAELVVSRPYVYNSFQTILIYLSQVVLLVFACSVLLYLIKSIKNNVFAKYFEDYSFSGYFLIFGLIAYPLSLLLARTNFGTFTNVFVWFSLIPVSILFAIVINSIKFHTSKINLSILLTGPVIILIYSGGLLLNYHPNVIYPDANMVLEFKQYKNPQLYESADWLFKQDPSTNIVGDKSVFDIYSGYFEFDQGLLAYAPLLYYSNATYYELRFLKWPIWYGNYDENLRREYLDYVIINTDITQLPSFLIGNPLDRYYLSKFDIVNSTNRIYDNQKIIIYENLK